jgi:3-methyladenine DNA glycosylase/8-oxoguanine DNA glycosylase
MSINLSTPNHFNLEYTIASHGWICLPPFLWNKKNMELSRVDILDSGNIVHFSIFQSSVNSIQIKTNPSQLNSNDKEDLIKRIFRMLRLNEDLEEFYNVCKEFGVNNIYGHGRLLRCTSLFEDLIKVILTTNTTWKNTESWSKRLVDFCGTSVDIQGVIFKTFPKPESIVNLGINGLRTQIRAGYRSEYIFKIAEMFMIDSSFHNIEMLDYLKMKRDLLALPGIGSYAVAILLMLLGFYNDIPMDSEARSKIYNQYFKKGKFRDKDLVRIYDRWGKWKALAYWLALPP